MKKELESIRVEYKSKPLNYNNLLPNPIHQLKLWLNDAIELNIKDANAVILSTFDKLYGVQSRVVLIKEITNLGLVFYTNYNSVKASQILNNNNVSLCFFWSKMERQIRINGIVEKTSVETSDNYWNSRPLNSRISALFSKQSSEVDKNYDLEKEFELFKNNFKDKVVKRPNNWGGYIVMPNKIEFWSGRNSRQHDRFVYKKNKDWSVKRLFP
tara:strand:- start:614 stop:1252 length:639 start_codon:yes stop_codon:yes gene_type:complete